MANLKNITKKMFIVKLSGAGAANTVTASWHGITSPSVNFEDTKIQNAEKGVMEHISGMVDYDNVTLKKLFDPAADDAISTFVNTYRDNREPFTVTINAVRPDAAGTLVPSAKSIVLSGCTIVKFKYPEVDRESTDAAMIELEVTVGEVQKQ
jgi:hypothetical protein